MKAAVLGSPVAHSLSPVLHAAGYAELGLTGWSYGRFELQADELAGFVAGLDGDWRGLSLTMPLKEACLAVAAEVTPLARRAGAGNTLVRLDSGDWRADNTDVPGLVDALRPAWEADWTRAAILGAGATARSALLALAELEVTRVHVYARNQAKGAAVPLLGGDGSARSGRVVRAAGPLVRRVRTGRVVDVAGRCGRRLRPPWPS